MNFMDVSLCVVRSCRVSSLVCVVMGLYLCGTFRDGVLLTSNVCFRMTLAELCEDVRSAPARRIANVRRFRAGVE